MHKYRNYCLPRILQVYEQYDLRTIFCSCNVPYECKRNHNNAYIMYNIVFCLRKWTQKNVFIINKSTISVFSGSAWAFDGVVEHNAEKTLQTTCTPIRYYYFIVALRLQNKETSRTRRARSQVARLCFSTGNRTIQHITMLLK